MALQRVCDVCGAVVRDGIGLEDNRTGPMSGRGEHRAAKSRASVTIKGVEVWLYLYSPNASAPDLCPGCFVTACAEVVDTESHNLAKMLAEKGG